MVKPSYKVGQVVKFILYLSDAHTYIGTIAHVDDGDKFGNSMFDREWLEIDFVLDGQLKRWWCTTQHIIPFTELERLIYG